MSRGAKVPGLEVKTLRGTARQKENKEDLGEKAERKEQGEEGWIQGRMEASKRYRTKEIREGDQQRETDNKR